MHTPLSWRYNETNAHASHTHMYIHICICVYNKVLKNPNSLLTQLPTHYQQNESIPDRIPS